MVKSMFDGQSDDEVEGHGIAADRKVSALQEDEGRRSASIEDDDTQGHVRSMLVDEDDDTAGHVVRH